MKNYLLITFGIFFIGFEVFGQDLEYSEIEYTVVAEGNDSPFENLQIVCFNKFFNLEHLTAEFRDKYDLDNRLLFKKKMLAQLFYIDTQKQGFDKFEIKKIKENPSEIVLDYSLVNSDLTNDSTVQAPFLIVQLPKNQKTNSIHGKRARTREGKGDVLKKLKENCVELIRSVDSSQPHHDTICSKRYKS